MLASTTEQMILLGHPGHPGHPGHLCKPATRYDVVEKMPHNLWNIKGFIAMYPSCNLLELYNQLCHPATHAKPRSILLEAQHIVRSDMGTLLESSQNLDVLILTSSQGWCVAYWMIQNGKKKLNLFAGYPRLAITGVLESLWTQPLDTEIWDGYYCKGMANVRELSCHHFA